MDMTRVVVRIDRLVLRGFRYDERHAIALGLQQELGRVFGDREAVPHLGAAEDRPRLSVGGVHLELGLKPQRIGANVAQGIGREIRK
jgi:hypothetical protein